MTAIVLDIETVPLASALAAPYPKDKRTPPGNYKKDEAIAAWYEKDEAEWRDARAKECSLSPRLGRVVCVGWERADEETGGERAAKTETHEGGVIAYLWDQIDAANGQIITFNGLNFDLPFLLFRSMVNGVDPLAPIKVRRDWNKRYSFGPHYDVRGVLTGWDSRRDGTLTDFAECLDCNTPQTVSGADIHALYQAGDFDAITEHCRSDVATTKALYQRVASIYGECGSW